MALRVERQDLFEDQLRASNTRSVRRASGLVLARHSDQNAPMSTLTEAVDKFRAYNLQSTNAEENLWSRGTFMKSALAGAAGSLIAGFDIGHASPVLLRKMISHVEHGWPNLWIPIHGSRWKVHPPDQVFKA